MTQHQRAAQISVFKRLTRVDGTSLRRIIILLILAGLACSEGSGAQTKPASAPRIVRSFPLTGVTKVILRAAAADAARVVVDPAIKMLEVSGLPIGGAPGYHSPDPKWRETPASEWGLDFVTAQFGKVLVISTKNEIRYIHHGYTLTDLSVRVPAGVEVIREPRQLTGEGKPDLSEPKPPQGEF